MPIRDCPSGRRDGAADCPIIPYCGRSGGPTRPEFSPGGTQSRIAMAQQVGGAVALDAPASSVSYGRTTP